MAKFPNYPKADFSSSQNFLARDPSGSGQVIRVQGQSMLNAAVQEILNRGDIVQAVDTLTEAKANDYDSGIYVLTGGDTVTLDGGQAIYRVSDPGSGGIVMDNGNELVLLFVANTPANIITPFESIADLPEVNADYRVSVTGYHPSTTVGGGEFVGNASARHDGVIYFDPDRSSEIGTAAYYVDSGIDVPCWGRGNYNRLDIVDAGGSPSLADNSYALDAMLKTDKGKYTVSYPGTYVFLLPTTSNFSADIEFNPDAIIDATGIVGTNWLHFEGSTAQISDLASDVSKGDQSLTLASAESLSEDDLITIYNPTDSSWSGFRANYRAGEFCTVRSVSGATVNISSPLYDSYVVADVDLYKISPLTVTLTNPNILGSSSADLISLKYCRDSKIVSPKINHQNNSCVLLSRCYDTAIEFPTIHNKGDGGDDYGVAISNSQNIYINGGGSIYSRRHSITTGGNNEINSFTCRNINVDGLALYNDIDSGVHNADFHGNTEDSVYRNCLIYGGATWQGKDNGYVNCRIQPNSIGVLITSAEIKGGNFYLRNCDNVTSVNPQTSSRGVIDIGGSTSPVSANTVETCRFEVTGGKWSGSNLGSNTFLVYFRNRGTTQKVNFRISDIDLDLNDFSTVLRTDLISGTADSDFIIIDNISTQLTAKPIVVHIGSSYANFPHRLPVLSGIETVTTSTSEIVTVGTSVNFKWAFPRTPHVSMSRTNRAAIGNAYGIAAATVADQNSITPVIRNELNANWTAATTVDLCWNATIREI